MWVYLLNIFLIILEAFVFLVKYKKKETFCCLASGQWILLSGLRHKSIGADTGMYYKSFEATKSTTIAQLLGEVKQIFNGGLQKSEDAGYYLFVKLLQRIIDDYQVYLIVVALIFMVSVGVWIFRYSQEPCMSFIIYSCLFYSFYSLTGIRQTIATALVVFVGYYFIEKRKLIPFIAIVVVAITIHKSSIVFAPFYFMSRIKLKTKNLLIQAIIYIVVLVLGRQLYVPLASVLGYEDAANYVGTGTGTFALMMILITVFSLYCLPFVDKNDVHVKSMYNAQFLATLGTLLTFQSQSFMRFQQYYSVFIMLLIPYLLKCLKKKERIVVWTMANVILIIMFIGTSPKYMFYWEGL